MNDNKYGITDRMTYAFFWFLSLSITLYLAKHHFSPIPQIDFVIIAMFGIFTSVLFIGWQFLEVGIKDRRNKIRQYDEAPEAFQKKIVANLNPVYQQEVRQVSINPKQAICHVLYVQYKDKMKVDLTEAYWLKRKNYLRVGIGSPEEWKNAMQDLETIGVIKRKNKLMPNSARVPNDWGKIRMLARGARL